MHFLCHTLLLSITPQHVDDRIKNAPVKPLLRAMFTPRSLLWETINYTRTPSFYNPPTHPIRNDVFDEHTASGGMQRVKVVFENEIIINKVNVIRTPVPSANSKTLWWYLMVTLLRKQEKKCGPKDSDLWDSVFNFAPSESSVCNYCFLTSFLYMCFQKNISFIT